jgi:hypothetical protein
MVTSASIILFGSVLSTRALALNESTHELVNRQAAITSTLDSTLKSNLGFAEGLLEKFNGQSALRWLELGGRYEDDGLRFLRHFHDPLRPWDRAGLGLFSSSVRWMQDPGQAWSWAAARRYYLQALTGETREARERAWAKTLQALGQLMHLVVDASVPEHVRNDAHPLGPIFGNYEYWVSGEHGRPGSPQEAAFLARYLATPLGFATWLLREPTGDPQAPLPIARLLDNDWYHGALSGPNVTFNPASGIAEIANANFLPPGADA